MNPEYAKRCACVQGGMYSLSRGEDFKILSQGLICPGRVERREEHI